jgi:phosphatidylcholine synthase
MKSVAWIAHLYTALGAVAALLATLAVFSDDYRSAFLWLGLQIFIDSTDGLLARALRVQERIPWFDGALLDNIIDYLTYVFVPAVILIRANLVPSAWGVWIAGAILIASGYGFSRTDAKVKVGEYFFTGFPSYWNIVVLYMFVFRLAPVSNALILIGFVVLVFVPIRYVYPSRTETLRSVTMLLGFSWAAMVIWMVWQLPDTSGPWALLSLIFPVYYNALSLWLSLRSSSSS